MSTDCIEALFEYRDEREPAALPGGARFSSPPYPSYRSSTTGFSLCSFLPKNDLPAEVCLDLSVEDVEGMLTGVGGETKGAAWAFIHEELPPPHEGFVSWGGMIC